MAKFKEGDQVINLAGSIQIPYGVTGTIQEVRSNYCIVIWNNGVTHPREEHELELQLLAESSSPTPEMGPVEGTMEYWRWEKSANVLAAMTSDPSRNGSHEAYAEDAVKFVDCLIAELKKGGAQ